MICISRLNRWASPRTTTKYNSKALVAMSEDATFVSLLHAHIIANADYQSYVPAYKAYRFCKITRVWQIVSVGAHTRRKALYGQLSKTLPCVCKFQQLSVAA